MLCHDLEDPYRLASLAGCIPSSQRLLEQLSNNLVVPDAPNPTPSLRPRLVVWVDDFATFAYQSELANVD